MNIAPTSTNDGSTLETKSKKDAFRSALLFALVGALGVGMQLESAIRRAATDSAWGNVLTGFLWLAFAVRGAIRVLRLHGEDRD